MAVTINFYDSFREYLGDGTIDLDTHAFKVALLTSSYTPSASTHTVYADISGSEVSSTNTGYTTGGATLTGVTWTKSGATVTLDAADASWVAGTAGLTARYAVIYDDTPTVPSKPLVAYVTFDSDVTASSGNTFTLAWNSSGILTLS